MTLSETTFKLVEKLDEIQQFLDKEQMYIPYKRAYVAYLGGLIRAPIYNKIRKQALNAGADELTIDALDRFITHNDLSSKLFKAFYYVTYHNKPIKEAAVRFNVSSDLVKMMLKSNPFGLFFDWVKRPREF